MKTWMLLSVTGLTLMGGVAIAGAVNTTDRTEKMERQVADEVKQKNPELAEQEAQVSYKEVTTEDVLKLREAHPDITLIDARSAEDYAKEHIPGAVQMRPSEIAEKLPQIQKDKLLPVIFYCTDTQCQASAKAAHAAKEAGYTNLKRYTAGLKAWKEAKQPVTTKN